MTGTTLVGSSDQITPIITHKEAKKSLGGRAVEWIKEKWDTASTFKRVMMVGIPIFLLIAALGLGIAGWQTGFFESAGFKDFWNITMQEPSGLSKGQVIGICAGVVGTLILGYLGFKYGIPKIAEMMRRDPPPPPPPQPQPDVNLIDIKKGKDIDNTGPVQNDTVNGPAGNPKVVDGDTPGKVDGSGSKTPDDPSSDELDG